MIKMDMMTFAILAKEASDVKISRPDDAYPGTRFVRLTLRDNEYVGAVNVGEDRAVLHGMEAFREKRARG